MALGRRGGSREERWLLGRRGGSREERWLIGRRGGFREERWLNGSAPDCKSVVLGSNPAPPQHSANSASPEVGATWDDTVPCAGL